MVSKEDVTEMVLELIKERKRMLQQLKAQHSDLLTALRRNEELQSSNNEAVFHLVHAIGDRISSQELQERTKI